MNREHNTDKTKSRRMLTGIRWYWIDRAVITHARDIGAIGIAVYNVLASMADGNQECFPSQQYIAELLGYSRATVNKAIRILRLKGLIEVKKQKYFRCRYQLLDLQRRDTETRVSTRGNTNVSRVDSNNNQLTRINNNTYGEKRFDEQTMKKIGNFLPGSRQELLAFDIAAGLNDFGNLFNYLSLSKRYQENLLRRILSEAREVPEKNIKKSRGALFNHLLRTHINNINMQ